MAILSAAGDNSQFNLAGGNTNSHGKVFTLFVQATIGLFTVALVWFSFIFYPQVVDKYKNVGLPQSKVVTNAEASNGFPIETAQFRVVFEREPNTYYAFIEGSNLAEYADNKNSATLAIKNALSLVSVCELNIVYVSTVDLDVPQDLRAPASCR